MYAVKSMSVPSPRVLTSGYQPKARLLNASRTVATAPQIRLRVARTTCAETRHPSATASMAARSRAPYHEYPTSCIQEPYRYGMTGVCA